MYYLNTIETKVRILPSELSEDIKTSIKEKLKTQYEGVLDRDLGLIVKVCDVEDVKDGKVIHGDPGIHYSVKFTLVSFKPKPKYVVRSKIKEILEFGAFVSLGPLDGLIHISQSMDDFVEFDPQIPAYIGKNKGWKLRVEDEVLARIVAVSLKESSTTKIALTMRQPHLGKKEWNEKKEEDKKTN